MSTPKVSVVIPVYNTEKYLRACLSSLVNQTYSNIEIIIINDGSSDDSGLICEEYSKSDERITFIDKDNEGVSVARNIGITLAKGEWIHFLDSDDFLDLDAFEKLINIASNTNCDVIQFGLRRFRAGNIVGENKPSNYREYQNLELFLRENELKPVAAWLHFIKSSIIKNNKIRFNEKLKHNEDMLFVYSFYCHSKKIVVINDIIHNQVLREDSVSHKPIEIKVLRDKLLFLSELCDYVRNQRLIKQYKEEINELFKVFFVTATHYREYRCYKSELQTSFRALYQKNKDILDKVFIKIAYYNIDLIIYPLKATHKLRNIK